MLNSILLFAGLGATEVILIVVVVLLMFGGKKIPELMRGLGKGIRNLRPLRMVMLKTLLLIRIRKANNPIATIFLPSDNSIVRRYSIL